MQQQKATVQGATMTNDITNKIERLNEFLTYDRWVETAKRTNSRVCLEAGVDTVDDSVFIYRAPGGALWSWREGKDEPGESTENNVLKAITSSRWSVLAVPIEETPFDGWSP